MITLRPECDLPIVPVYMFERDYPEPLGFQLEYARRLSRFTLPYPDIAS